MPEQKFSELKTVTDLRTLYLKRRKEINRRLRDFKKVKPSDYFYELVYCLLTPQSSAENALYVTEELRRNNFEKNGFNPESILRNSNKYIRFHKTKSKRLVALKSSYPLIKKKLRSEIKSHDMRDWLVKNVDGFGMKEASHFLRNIGYPDLAILDRHILKCLYQLKVIGGLPASLTVKKYLQIEKKFKIFSDKCGISMDELDLLFWSLGTGRILK